MMGCRPRTGKWRVPAAVTLAALLSCAPVLGDAQWVTAPPYSVTMSNIQHKGQASEGSLELLVSHDAACSLSVTTAEVLTAGGRSLTTSYKITNIANGDTDWVSSTAFIGRNYALPGSGMKTVILSVKGEAPGGTVPEPGNYSAGVVLTLTF
jgi:hypothetical protein